MAVQLVTIVLRQHFGKNFYFAKPVMEKQLVSVGANALDTGAGNDHMTIISQRMHCIITLHKLCSAFQRWKYPSKDTAPSS